MSSKTIYGFDARLNWITEEASQTVTATGGGGSYAYLIAITNQFGAEPKRNDEITDNQCATIQHNASDKPDELVCSCVGSGLPPFSCGDAPTNGGD